MSRGLSRRRQPRLGPELEKLVQANRGRIELRPKRRHWQLRVDGQVVAHVSYHAESAKACTQRNSVARVKRALKGRLDEGR